MNNEILTNLQQFIDEYYRPNTFFQSYTPSQLKELIANRESFADILYRFIEAAGITDIECYTRARIDRKLFSKIKTDPEYHPSRHTACAFALALHLDMEQTGKLLASVGYCLLSNCKYDVIIAYFIRNEIYDMDTINEVLAEYEEPLF